MRPNRRITPTKEPLTWWSFAVKSVVNEIKEKRAKKTWKRLERFKRDRLMYITLYKKKILYKKKTSEIVLDKLNQLENRLEYEDIVLFRSLTEALIRKEMKDKRNEKKGWFGGWFHKKDEDIYTMEEISFSDWKYLYKKINFLEEKVKDVVPPEYVKLKASFEVGEGSFELVGDDPKNNQNNNEVVKIIQAGFEGFHVDVEQRPNGETVHASLLSIAVVDHFTLLKEEDSVEMVSLNESQISQATHFFTIQFDRNPLDSSANMRLRIAALQSLNITFGMDIINRIVKFFSHESNANQLKLAANNTWDSLKESAEVQVKYALDKRKVIELEIDVAAPNVMIPAGFTDPKASMLIIELGTLSMRSDTNNRQNAISRSGNDIQVVNQDFYYDKFKVNITSIHVIVSDRSFSHNQQYNQVDIDLVQKFDINVDLFLCSVTSPDLPKLRMSGVLPKLRVLVSPIKIGHIFSILRSFSASSSENNQLLLEDSNKNNQRDLNDINNEKLMLIKAQKEAEKKMDNLLQVDFKFTDLELNLHRDIAVKEGDDRQLILLQIHKFKLHFSKTSHYLKANIAITSLNILDYIQQYSENLYLVQSKGSEEADYLVTISYTGIPKFSPIFKSIEHSFDINFNTLEIVVNRETVASLLTYTNSCLEQMKGDDDKPVVASNNIEKNDEGLSIIPISETKVDSILLQANIQIGGLKATLMKGGSKFVKSELTNSVVRAAVHTNNEIKLSGYLGNILVDDYSNNTLWKEIVVNTGENNRILEFWFETVNADIKNDSLAKIIITLQISSVRVIFLSKFLKSLLGYLTELSQMQNLLSSTAKKAKKTAETVSSTASTQLIIFDISVANPQVIIPSNSNDRSNYVVANLGDISITNKLEKVDSGVMLDSIKMKISDISMFSIHRDKDPKRRDIIENTDINIDIFRAAFWNDSHQYPDITANIKIRRISIKLCELQYHLLVGILSGNLAEIPDQSPDLDNFKHQLKDLKDEYDESHKQIELSESKILLDFAKYKFALVLYHTSLELYEGDGIIADGTEFPLIKLAIHDLITKGSLSDLGTLESKLKIASVSIIDTRPNIDNHFKKLISPYKEEDPELILLSFMRDPVGNITSDIVLNSPRVFLIPDLIFKVKDFALNNLNYLTKSMEEMKKNTIEEKKEKEEVKEEPKTNPTGIHAKINIIDPQVCLIENTKDKDSRLLVLKQSLDIDYTMNSSGVQHASININSIQLFKTRIVTGNPIQILTPFNMKLQYELMPKEIMSILIDFDEIDLKISYSDFKLLMIIKNNWMEALPKTETKQQITDEVVDKYKLKKREQKKEVLLIESEEEKKKREDNIILHESLRVVFAKIKLLLLNDCYEDATNTPLLDLALDEMDSRIENWSSELKGHFNLIQMKVFYYNNSLNTNEPMIEPWDFNASFFKGNDNCFNAKLVAPDSLNMNISKSFVETLLNNLEQWQLDYYDQVSAKRTILHPFYIINQTGIPLTYWITGTQKRITIENGVELPLDISEINTNRDQIDQEFLISMQLEADDLIPVHNLPVLKKTTMLFDLTSKSSVKLLYTIEFRQGSRLLIFGSDFSIVNNTNTPLDAQLQHNQLPTLLLENIKPMEKKYIPLRYAINSTLKFKPSNQTFRWSKETINSSSLKRDSVPIAITCPPEGNTPNWIYSLQVKGDREQKGKSKGKEGNEVIFTFFAPLKLENTLPEKLNYLLKGGSGEDLANGSLEIGESREIFFIQKEFRPKLLLNINGYNYSSPYKLGGTNQSFIQIESKTKRILMLGIDNVTTPFGSRSTTVFVKYWLYNKTGDKLKYKNAQLLNLGSTNNSKAIAGDSEVIVTSKNYSLTSSNSNYSISDSDSSLMSGSELLFDGEHEDIRYIKPFIFSGDSLSLRNNLTAWSTSVSLKSNGGVIEALKLNEKRVADPHISQLFSVLVQSAPGRYYRTSVVKITPHYIFINKTNQLLEVRQKGEKISQEISNNDQTHFNWNKRDIEKYLQFTFVGNEFDWSSPFSIDSANSFQVPIWREGELTPIYVRITVNITGNQVTVIFLCSDEDYPDYRIENYSSHAIIISELNENKSYKVESEYSIPFAWNSPLSPKKLIAVNVPRTAVEATVSLDKLNIYPYLNWPNISGVRQFVSVEVIADGPTKVLIIDDLSPDLVEEYDSKLNISNANSSSSRKLELIQEEYSNKDDIKVLLNVVLELNEIGFSIIDEKPQELLYLNLRKIEIILSLLENTQSIELSVGSLQIDNQLLHTQYPIFFYSAPIEGQPFFQLSVLRSEKYPKIFYFPYFGVKLQKFDVQLDEIFLLRLLNFGEILTKFMAERKVEEEENELFKTSEKYFLDNNSSEVQSTMLYFDILHINPLMMNITFSAVGGRDQDTSGGVLEKTLRAGGFLASIDNAPLRLNGLILENPFISQSQLISRVIQHYTQQGLREFYLLLGSADVLGNPVSLVSNLGTGVYDFFHEPAEGIVNSPQEFAIGVARGTKSLVKNSVFGVFNSASKISGTISKAATTISLDEDWQRSRAKKMGNKPQHLGQGLKKGVKNLGVGVFEGVTGIISQPFKGFFNFFF